MFGSSIGHLSLVAAIDWQNAFQTLVGIPLKDSDHRRELHHLVAHSHFDDQTVTKKLVNKARSPTASPSPARRSTRPTGARFDVAKTPGSRRGHRVVAALDYNRVHRLSSDPSVPSSRSTSRPYWRVRA